MENNIFASLKLITGIQRNQDGNVDYIENLRSFFFETTTVVHNSYRLIEALRYVELVSAEHTYLSRSQMARLFHDNIMKKLDDTSCMKNRIAGTYKAKKYHEWLAAMAICDSFNDTIGLFIYGENDPGLKELYAYIVYFFATVNLSQMSDIPPGWGKVVDALNPAGFIQKDEVTVLRSGRCF